MKVINNAGMPKVTLWPPKEAHSYQQKNGNNDDCLLHSFGRKEIDFIYRKAFIYGAEIGLALNFLPTTSVPQESLSYRLCYVRAVQF